MLIHKDFKWVMEALDNPDSHIHHYEFRKLKETFIKNLTTEYWIDSYGDIITQKSQKSFREWRPLENITMTILMMKVYI